MANIIALIIFGILAIAGFALTILGIGGTFLVLLGAIIYDLIVQQYAISLNILFVLGGLAVLGEILEWVVSSAAVKKKSSNWAVIGTLAGAIVGASMFSWLFLGIPGLIIGAILGAYLAELTRTHDAKRAWNAAKAALKGRALVSITKTLLLVVQVILVIRAVF